MHIGLARFVLPHWRSAVASAVGYSREGPAVGGAAALAEGWGAGTEGWTLTIRV